VAQASDLDGVTTQRVPRPSGTLRRAGVGNAGAGGFDQAARGHKSTGIGSIAAHLCEKRKDGGNAAHGIVKGGGTRLIHDTG